MTKASHTGGTNSDSLPASASIRDARKGASEPPPVATAAVIGGSGFTGALLAELLLRHRSASLTHVTSEQLAGSPVRAHLPRVRTDLRFTSAAEAVDAAAEIAFVCLPHGEAAPVVKRLLDAGSRVVDLSADFRLTRDVYEEWYAPHPCPELTPAVYGLTELHRGAISPAALVANPGCYPTAALLALQPLKQLGPLDVVIDAKSGVSGAGKTPKASTHFCAVDSDLTPYGIGTHRHYPEILAGLASPLADEGDMEVSGHGDADRDLGADGDGNGHGETSSLTFVPHLAPLQRGITETIYVRPKAGPLPDPANVLALYKEAYTGESFVEVCDAPPHLLDVAGTNVCRIFATVDPQGGRLVIVSVIDNLMKGACGQAVQNMNLMLGLPEEEGLL